MIQTSGYFKDDRPLIKGEKPTTVKIDGSIQKGDLYADRISLEFDPSYFSELNSSNIQAYTCEISPCGNYLAIGVNTSPYIYIYKINIDNFTKLSNPSVLPSNEVKFISWSPNSEYLALFTNNSPFIVIYKRNGDVFTKLSNPSSLPSGSPLYQGTFSPDNSQLVYIQYGSNTNETNFVIYSRSGDTFTKINSPNDLPINTYYASSVSYTPDNKYCLFSMNSNEYYYLYRVNGNTFTRYHSNIDQIPHGNVKPSFFYRDFFIVLQDGNYKNPVFRIYTYDSSLNVSLFSEEYSFTNYSYKPEIVNIDGKTFIHIPASNFNTFNMFTFIILDENKTFTVPATHNYVLSNSGINKSSITKDGKYLICCFSSLHDEYKNKHVRLYKIKYSNKKIQNLSALSDCSEFGYSVETGENKYVNTMNLLKWSESNDTN